MDIEADMEIQTWSSEDNVTSAHGFSLALYVIEFWVFSSKSGALDTKHWGVRQLKQGHVVSQAINSINKDWGLSRTHWVTSRNTNMLLIPFL